MEQSNMLPSQTDFLDLKRTLTELFSGPIALTFAIFTSLFALSFVGVLLSVRSSISIIGLAAVFLPLLLSLCSTLGLWLIFFAAKKEKLCRTGLLLSRVLPVAGAIFSIMLCIGMAAVLIVVLFSNSMVNASMAKISETLSGSYFSFSEYAFMLLSRLPISIITIAAVLMALFTALIALRCLTLCSFQKQLCIMAEKNQPKKGGAGFVAFLCYLLGCAFTLIGGVAAKHNLSGGICIALYGGTLFTEGLILHKTSIELNFLCTYYSKLNRSVKKRADAIRAQKEALMNAPLAISAPESENALVADIPSAADAPDVIVPPAPDIEEGDVPDIIIPPVAENEAHLSAEAEAAPEEKASEDMLTNPELTV